MLYVMVSDYYEKTVLCGSATPHPLSGHEFRWPPRFNTPESVLLLKPHTEQRELRQPTVTREKLTVEINPGSYVLPDNLPAHLIFSPSLIRDGETITFKQLAYRIRKNKTDNSEALANQLLQISPINSPSQPALFSVEIEPLKFREQPELVIPLYTREQIRVSGLMRTKQGFSVIPVDEFLSKYQDKIQSYTMGSNPNDKRFDPELVSDITGIIKTSIERTQKTIMIADLLSEKMKITLDRDQMDELMEFGPSAYTHTQPLIQSQAIGASYQQTARMMSEHIVKYSCGSAYKEVGDALIHIAKTHSNPTEAIASICGHIKHYLSKDAPSHTHTPYYVNLMHSINAPWPSRIRPEPLVSLMKAAESINEPDINDAELGVQAALFTKSLRSLMEKGKEHNAIFSAVQALNEVTSPEKALSMTQKMSGATATEQRPGPPERDPKPGRIWGEIAYGADVEKLGRFRRN